MVLQCCQIRNLLHKPGFVDSQFGTTAPILCQGITLTYQIVVAHQIRVALGTFLEINKSSLSNKHSLVKIFLKKQ